MPKVFRGRLRSLKGAGSKTLKGISIKGISTFHDPSKGSERGANVIFNLSVDGMQVCHLGDLGHVLSDKEVSEIGPVDILLIPVGGYYTIDHKEATRVAEQIKPKVLIPMHFKTSKCTFPIAPVDDFLKGKKECEAAKDERGGIQQSDSSQTDGNCGFGARTVRGLTSSST